MKRNSDNLKVRDGEDENEMNDIYILQDTAAYLIQMPVAEGQSPSSQKKKKSSKFSPEESYTRPNTKTPTSESNGIPNKKGLKKNPKRPSLHETDALSSKKKSPIRLSNSEKPSSLKYPNLNNYLVVLPVTFENFPNHSSVANGNINASRRSSSPDTLTIMLDKPKDVLSPDSNGERNKRDNRTSDDNKELRVHSPKESSTKKNKRYKDIGTVAEDTAQKKPRVRKSHSENRRGSLSINNRGAKTEVDLEFNKSKQKKGSKDGSYTTDHYRSFQRTPNKLNHSACKSQSEETLHYVHHREPLNDSHSSCKLHPDEGKRSAKKYQKPLKKKAKTIMNISDGQSYSYENRYGPVLRSKPKGKSKINVNGKPKTWNPLARKSHSEETLSSRFSDNYSYVPHSECLGESLSSGKLHPDEGKFSANRYQEPFGKVKTQIYHSDVENMSIENIYDTKQRSSPKETNNRDSNQPLDRDTLKAKPENIIRNQAKNVLKKEKQHQELLKQSKKAAAEKREKPESIRYSHSKNPQLDGELMRNNEENVIGKQVPRTKTHMYAMKRYHIQIPETGREETPFMVRFNLNDENTVDMMYGGPVKINGYYSTNRYN